MNPPNSLLTITEWQSGEAAGKTLTAQDRKLAAQLTGAAGRLQLDELRSGVRVQATSWVGVVRFEQFTVQVTPKLAGGNLGLAAMLAWTSGLDALRRNQGVRTLDPAQQGHLFDLIALLFAQACDRIVRAGLLHDYVELEDDLPVVRGRLLAAQQVRRRFGRVDRLECRFDDHLSDVLENQILAAVLGLCRPRVQHPKTRLHIHRLHTLFATVCTGDALDLAHPFDDVIYHRLNEHYREAHALACLIAEGLQIEDLLASGQTRSFAFLLDMNRLFESFVAKVVAVALAGTGYRLHPQHQDRSVIWNVTQQRPYTHIRPDLLVTTPDGRHMVIDAKYKLYDERTVAAGDLYQSFLYAHAYGAPEAQPAPVLLLYPASGKDARSLHLQVRPRHTEMTTHLHTLSLPIPTLLQEAQQTTQGPLLSQLLVMLRRCLQGDSHLR